MVMHADYIFLQMFIWERFLMIASKLVEFSIMVTKDVSQADGSKKMKTKGTLGLVHGGGRMISHWLVSPWGKKLMRMPSFRPQAYSPRGIFVLSTFGGSNKEIELFPKIERVGGAFVYWLW